MRVGWGEEWVEGRAEGGRGGETVSAPSWERERRRKRTNRDAVLGCYEGESRLYETEEEVLGVEIEGGWSEVGGERIQDDEVDLGWRWRGDLKRAGCMRKVGK